MKLYNSDVLNPDKGAQQLQDKVLFDIRFYFMRRANENIDKFTKSTFKMETDSNTGLRYIVKVIDERTKNHQDDTELITAFMPEFPNSKLCPLKSYMSYLTQLHPKCDNLWQQVKKKEHLKDSDIWFQPRKIGPNPLASFMSRVSHDADLSRTYTNHSIRVTGTILLGRCNYSSKQIMSVTGHRSVNSLSVYQKVSENEKLMMGMSHTCYLQAGEINPIQKENVQPQIQQVNEHALQRIAPKPIPAALGAPPQPSEITGETSNKKCTEVVQYEPEDPILKDDFAQELNFDVAEILNDIEDEIQISQVANVTTASTSTTVEKHMAMKSPKIPLFSNCKIGSIGNINIHVH